MRQETAQLLEVVMAEIRIGTSGYSFKDWKGVFYPPTISDSSMLEFYTQFFDCVEINSTYYRILSPYLFRRMAERTPEDFDFVVKLHRSMTHDRASVHTTLEEFRASIEPLQELGKLKGLLAQFPWSFRNGKENREHILFLQSQFEGHPLFVEFRNDTWAAPGILSFLSNHNLYYCSVDEPDLPGLMPSDAHTTGDIGYVRFHGRNRENWFKKGVETTQRYRYLYEEEELKRWADKIKEISRQAKQIFVVFNNCYQNFGLKNAKMLLRLLQEQ